MSLAVVFHRATAAELAEAAEWYQARRSGLGQAFLDEIGRCVARAAAHPLQAPQVHERVRQIVAHRFPCSLYFVADDQRVVVIAVFHGRRAPSAWQRRIEPDSP